MGQFKYKVRNKEGKMQTGVLTSHSLSMAKTMLMRQRLAIVTLTEYQLDADGKEAGGLSLFGGRFRIDSSGNMIIGSNDNFAVPDKDLIVMTKQLAVMLESGLPINQSLNILSQQQPLPQFGLVLEGVGKAIEEGNGLGSALGRYPRCFDVLYLSMVKAGEESGRLPDIMGKLLIYIEKSAKIKSQVKSAMMYPVIVLLVAVVVVVGLLAFVVPVFASQFKGAGKPLPAITQIVVDLSDFVKSSWWKIVAGVVVFYMLFNRYGATVKGRRNIDSLLLNLPVLGGVMRKIAVGRFCSTMGSMLTSGVNLLQALTICASSAGNSTIEDFVLGCKAEIETGKQLSQPLSLSTLFPKMVVSMIQVGEKAGKMDVMLEKIAIFYEDEVDEAIKSMLGMIEPLMIVFIGIMVGFLVIAMYLPMMDLGSTVE